MAGKGKIVGYVVVRHGAGVRLGLYQRAPRGVLLRGNGAELFASRAAARRAITRTCRYCEKNGLGWGDGHEIITVWSEASHGSQP